jgi:hypothetical protein
LVATNSQTLSQTRRRSVVKARTTSSTPPPNSRLKAGGAQVATPTALGTPATPRASALRAKKPGQLW